MSLIVAILFIIPVLFAGEAGGYVAPAGSQEVESSGYPTKDMLKVLVKAEEGVKYPMRFFQLFGMAVARSYAGSDYLGLARNILSNINEKKSEYGFLVNFGPAYENPSYGRQFKCGWWRRCLEAAFIAAGINENFVITGDSYWDKSGDVGIVDSITNPNLVHTATGIIDKGKIYIFDPWQSGFDAGDKGPETGIAYLGNAALPKYNGELLRDWVEVQVRSGRPWIKFNGLSEIIESMPPSELLKDAQKKLIKAISDKRLVPGLDFTDGKGIIADTIPQQDRSKLSSDVLDRAREKAGQNPVDMSRLDILSLVEQVLIGKSSVDGDELIEKLIEKKLVFYTMTLNITILQEVEGEKTQNPVEGAKVKISDKDKTYELKDKGKGIYEIKFCGAGPFKIKVEAEGYVSVDKGKFLEAEIDVPPAKSKDTVYNHEALYMVPVYGTIEVKVKDDPDTGISGAAIQLYKDGKRFGEERVADGDGLAIYEKCPPGEYFALARAAYHKDGRSNTVTVSKEKDTGYKHSASIVLKPFMSEILADVVLRSGDGKESVMAGAVVDISDPGSIKFTATTDDKGKAVIKGVPPNPHTDYMLKAVKEGYAPDIRPGFKVLPDKDGQVFKIKLSLSAGSLIDVRVINGADGKPIEGVSVNLSGPENRNSFTDISGKVVFEQLPLGAFYISASAQGYGRPDDKEIVLKGGEAMTRVTITLYPGIRLKVYVKDKDKPKGEDLISGSYVSLGQGNEKFCATGTCEFNLDAARSYEIRAWARGYSPNTATYSVPVKPVFDRDSISILLKYGMSLTKEHESALTHILIELRLKRGLSVILGDVGTGKTTLSRKFVQELKGRDDFIFNIILDPSFENEHLFLTSLARDFDINMPAGSASSIIDLRESLENFLFQKGVTENRIVTLIIDEAQKLNEKSK
ncbi:MAG: carboxypeptidase regulatory-like domain-containing protein [Candidatus Omnitrophica bacterium]|nr:carboxypeptidase regulatory-like domain-containing protein [Candidatus Omnitrophota bacterium]